MTSAIAEFFPQPPSFCYTASTAEYSTASTAQAAMLPQTPAGAPATQSAPVSAGNHPWAQQGDDLFILLLLEGVYGAIPWVLWGIYVLGVVSAVVFILSTPDLQSIVLYLCSWPIGIAAIFFWGELHTFITHTPLFRAEAASFEGTVYQLARNLTDEDLRLRAIVPDWPADPTAQAHFPHIKPLVSRYRLLERDETSIRGKLVEAQNLKVQAVQKGLEEASAYKRAELGDEYRSSVHLETALKHKLALCIIAQALTLVLIEHPTWREGDLYRLNPYPLSLLRGENTKDPRFPLVTFRDGQSRTIDWCIHPTPRHLAELMLAQRSIGTI